MTSVDRKFFQEYKLVTTKDQNVTFKEDKLLALVPFGITIDNLSILTYKDGQSVDSDSLGEAGAQISQQMIEIGYPLLNCEGADEDFLDNSKITLILMYEGKDMVSNPIYVPYNIIFKKGRTKFDWLLLIIFVLVVFLILVLLVYTCNNFRMVKNTREEYSASFRKYLRAKAEIKSSRKKLVKKLSNDDDSGFVTEDDLPTKIGHARNRVKYTT